MVLIAMNALVWIAVVATGGSDSKLNQALALLPDSANYMFPGGSVEFVRGVSDGAWWQLLTSGFLHVDLLHEQPLGHRGRLPFTVFAASSISWQGHLGGFVGGVLVAAVLVFAPRARRNLVQGAGLGLVLVAAVAAIALRVFMLT